MDSRARVWVLPLDHSGSKWKSEKWHLPVGKKVTLLNAEGPAGLRLPLASLHPDDLKRALVLEVKSDGLHAFFPPLLQPAFMRLLRAFSRALKVAKISRCLFEGYIPSDDLGLWSQLSLTPDPGVLEINLPPCSDVENTRRG